MTLVVSCLLLAGAVPACSSDDGDEMDQVAGSAADPNPAGSQATAAGSGASGTNGRSGRAGSSASAGSGANAGSEAQSSGPDVVTGKEPVDPSAGQGAKGCRSDGDCQMGFVCVPPGQRPPSGCGTACCLPQSMTNPQCNPNLAMLPKPCAMDGDCRPPQARCVNNSCSGCMEDSECAVSAPHCVMTRCMECRTDPDCTRDPARTVCINGGCFECSLDAQCPAERPRCKGSCVECLATADCAQGVCQNDRCVPECTSDEECAVPGWPRRCGANLRCENVPCERDAECPSRSVCSTPALFCTAKTCRRDADCLQDAPYCVEGTCFRFLAACYFGGPWA